ncbi:hypothetical protein C8R42DRAFT_727472 [Lentinula raphanica]|nr:hypothetical protein C8R42DRAFT_727472 [Lentinula raphanica]
MRFIIPTCLAAFTFGLATTVVQGMPMQSSSAVATQSEDHEVNSFVVNLRERITANQNKINHRGDLIDFYVETEIKFLNGQSTTPNPKLDRSVRKLTSGFVRNQFIPPPATPFQEPAYEMSQIRDPVFAEGSHFYEWTQKDSLYVEFDMTATTKGKIRVRATGQVEEHTNDIGKFKGIIIKMRGEKATGSLLQVM